MSVSAATFPVTRARADRKRKIGFANAVAQGRLLYRVGVISDSELDAIRRLANMDRNAYDRYRREEDTRRREASKARTSLWPDSAQAKQDAFLRRRQKEKEEAERRENILLELDAQQQEEERRQRQAQLALCHLKDDPRGRNVRSLRMLHETLKDCEMQIAYKNNLKVKDEEEERKKRDAMERDLREYKLKLRQEKFDQRSRNVEEKNSHLQQMLFQIKERKQQLAEKKMHLAEVKRAAEEEAQENAEEAREEQRKIALVHEHNRSVARPPLTKHDRLNQRIERDKDVDELLVRQEEKVNAMKRAPMERWRKKQEWFEKCKEESLRLFLAEKDRTRHKERTQDVFEQRGVSVIEAIAAGEERQRQRRLEERRQRREEFLRIADGHHPDEDLPPGVRRANAHRAGFVDDDEARRYQMEMRQRPALALAEERAEAARRREEAERVRQIQRLQAAEKKENDRRETAEMVEARQRQEKAMEEDDENYRIYVKSQLPSDMDPYLYNKAMRLNT